MCTSRLWTTLFLLCGVAAVQAIDLPTTVVDEQHVRNLVERSSCPQKLNICAQGSTAPPLKLWAAMLAPVAGHNNDDAKQPEPQSQPVVRNPPRRMGPFAVIMSIIAIATTLNPSTLFNSIAILANNNVTPDNPEVPLEPLLRTVVAWASTVLQAGQFMVFWARMGDERAALQSLDGLRQSLIPRNSDLDQIFDGVSDIIHGITGVIGDGIEAFFGVFVAIFSGIFELIEGIIEAVIRPFHDRRLSEEEDSCREQLLQCHLDSFLTKLIPTLVQAAMLAEVDLGA